MWWQFKVLFHQSDRAVKASLPSDWYLKLSDWKRFGNFSHSPKSGFCLMRSQVTQVWRREMLGWLGHWLNLDIANLCENNRLNYEVSQAPCLFQQVKRNQFYVVESLSPFWSLVECLWYDKILKNQNPSFGIYFFYSGNSSQEYRFSCWQARCQQGESHTRSG